MYLVVPRDKRKTKVLPGFLVKPLLEKSMKVGEYHRVQLKENVYEIREHNV